MSGAGQASWARELGAARDYAKGQIRSVGKARGWSTEVIAWAEAIVDTYAEDADGFFGDDVPGFWLSLARHFRDVLDDGSVQVKAGVVVPIPTGLDKFVGALETAAAAAAGTASHDDLSSAWGLARDTAAASAGDVADAAVHTATTLREFGKAAGKGTELLRSKGVVAGLAGLVGLTLLGGLFARARGRA